NAPENNDGTSSRPSVAAAPATTHTARPGRRLAWACSGASGGGSPDPPGPVPAAGGVSSAVNLVSFPQWQLSPPTRPATARSFTGVAILRRRPPPAGTGAPPPAAHGIRTGGPACLLPRRCHRSQFTRSAEGGNCHISRDVHRTCRPPSIATEVQPSIAHVGDDF